MGNENMFLAKTRKTIFIIITLLVLFSLTAIGFTARKQTANADGETLIASLSVTINEQTGRGSATAPDYSLTSGAFRVNKVSASAGVGNFSVSFMSSGTYLFDESLTLTVNGKSFTNFEMAPNYGSILIHYTGATNYVEVYDGSTLVTSAIDFGTVDKSQLGSATKTIKIKNIGSAPTYAMAVGLTAPSSGGSGDSSGSGGVAFLASSSSLTSVTAGSETTFTLSAISSLSVGSYTNTIQIKSTGMNAFNGYPIDVSFTITLTVTQSTKLTVYENSTEVSDGTEYDFGTVDKDNLSTVTKTFTLKNEGAVAITALELELGQSESVYTLDKFAIESLAVGASTTVTVSAVLSAPKGEYQYIPLQWKNGDESVSGYVVLKIKITEKDPYVLEAYNETTKLLPSSTYNFGTTEYGDPAPSAKTFRIVNAGNNATGDLTVYLQYKGGTDLNGYNYTKSIPSIAKGGEATLTVQPKEGSVVGTFPVTVNVYNSNVSVTFGITYTVHGMTEIPSVSVESGYLTAPVADAKINNKNLNQTGYGINIQYQEKFGSGDWTNATTANFKAGKSYRIRVVAFISDTTSYIFAENVPLTLGGVSAEDITRNAQRTQVTGYKTFEALSAVEYSLEMVCTSPKFSSNVYNFDNVEDEYTGCPSADFVFNNLGLQDSGELTVSFVLYNTSTPGQYYEYSPTIPNLKQGESFVLEIKPILGLEPNPLDYYWETVTISNSRYSFTFDVKLRVDKKPYKMTVEYDHIEFIPALNDTQEVEYILTGGETAVYGFDYLYAVQDRPYENLKVGYSATDANRFERCFDLVNKGNNQLTGIAVTHTGTGDQYFTVDTSNLQTSVDASNYARKSTFFTVKPKTGAPAGTHKTTVVITCDNLDPILITFTFTVHIEISEVVISGLTIPEGYDEAPRDLVVETEGVYIRILGWAKVGTSSAWLGKNNTIFRAGDQYKLNLHLNTKTGYVFRNRSTDISWSGSKIAFNFTLSFNGIDLEAEALAGNLISQSLMNETFSANGCYYTATFVAKEPTLKGTAKIDIYDYPEEYVLNANYGVEGLDLASNLSFMWYKDGVALAGEFSNANSYYTLTKSTISEDATYYYEIHHATREGTMRSESIVIGPDTRLKPTGTVVQVVNPATCLAFGTVTWNRDGLEYRIASPYDDPEDTYTDWIEAEVEEKISQGTGTGTGTGSGGGTGVPVVTYEGTVNIAGGTILWFRYKETLTLSASDIGIFTVEKGSHVLVHHDAVIPEPEEICLVNAIQEYNYCSVCGKYFDMYGNEFPSVDYVTTYATGHKDADGDLFCDVCGISLMNKYYLRVETLDDIVAGAKYIIVNSNGQVMEMIKSVSANGGKYVSALNVTRPQSDIDNDRYASSDIDKIDAFVFQINTIPSKSTDVKTCYSFYIGDTCIDFANGLVLSPKSWNAKTGFSITLTGEKLFTIASWNGSKTLSEARLKSDGSCVFTVATGGKLLSSTGNLRIYRMVSSTTTLDGNDCEVKEKKTVSDYSKMEGNPDKLGKKSVVSGVIDAIDEEYVKSFAKKKDLKSADMKMDIESSVEVLSQTDSALTLDVHPTISCGDKAEVIPDKNLNGKEMLLTLYVGKVVPDSVKHELTSGGVEYFYKEATLPGQKTFRYEIDDDGNVFVTFVVTEFSTFVAYMPESESASISGTVEISGTAKVGETLTAEVKDSNIDLATISYVWERDGVAISGATAQTYTLTNADKGAKITVTVSDNVHTGTLISSETAEVAEASGSGGTGEGGGKTAIAGTIELNGTAKVGEYLYFEVKDGNVDDATKVYTWYRGSSVISGVTDYYYMLTDADKGYKIHVTVADGVHDGFLMSAETAEVADSVEALTGTAEISGTAKVGETLTASVKDSNLDNATAIYEWFRDDGPIAGACATTYTIQASDKGYKIYVKVHDTTHNGTLTSAETAEVTEKSGSGGTGEGGGKEALTGTVEITGTAKVGETLTASVKDSNLDNSTAVYIWLKGGSPANTGSTYTLTDSDKGCKLIVMVTDGVHDGNIMSSETEEVAESSSNAPSVGKTDCTNCLNNDGTLTDVDSTMEYSADGRTWNVIRSTMVTGLTNGLYYIRYQATEGKEASESASVEIGAGSHTFGVWHDEVPADCKNNGTKGYKLCSVCEKYFDREEKEIADIVITATEHKWGEVTYTWSRDYATCTAKRICENEPSHIQEEEATANATVTRDADCFNSELTTFEAEFRGEAFSKQMQTDIVTKSATDHDWDTVTYTWSEDNSSCTAKRICKNDNKHIEEESATITSDVTQTQTCENAEIANLTATFENTAFATQEKEGVQTKSALGHDYQFNKIEWTNFTAKAIFVCTHDGSHRQSYNCEVTDEVTTVANCVTEGVRTYTATYEDYEDTKEENLGLDEENHDIEHFNAKDATCEEEGWEAYDACKRCTYSTKVSIPATDHDWDTVTYTWSEDNSSCTAQRICKNDNKHIEEESATITSDVTQTQNCENAEIANLTATFENTAFATQEKEGVQTKSALGHDYQFNKIEWTNFTAKAIFVCTHDGNHRQSYNCEVTDEVTTVANCVTEGVRTYTATYEDYEDAKEENLGLDEENHDIEHFNAKDATCEEEGWEAYDACKRCTYSTKVSISAINHDWDTVTYTWSEDNSSCTAKRICKNDESHIEEETAEAIYTVDSEATCVAQETGHFTAIFQNENFTSQVKNIGKEGYGDHTFGEWIVLLPAKCSRAGSRERYCLYCTEKETEEIELLPHTFGEWETTKEATFTEKGSRKHVCSECLTEETEEIAKIDATPYFKEALEAVDMSRSIEDIYEKLSQALYYYDAIEDKTAVTDEYATLDALVEKYQTLTKSVNEEYEVTEEVEKNYFMSVLQLINYLAIATYILLKGKRRFL